MDNNAKIEIVETQFANRELDTDAFLRNLILDKSTGRISTTNLQDIGQMESMPLPEDWQEIRYPDSGDGSSFRQFQAPDNQSSLNFYYRGTRVDGNSASALKQTLNSPEHLIMGAELTQLSEVLRNKDSEDGFALAAAQTKTINGKMVLQVEGTYTKQKVDNVSLYIDSDGKGSAVQEIFYQGPQSASEHKRQAKRAMASIQWK
jgi:hypothetical protein